MNLHARAKHPSAFRHPPSAFILQRMGMTAVEKILSRASGVAEARAGDILYPKVDFAMIHDGVVMGAKQELDELENNVSLRLIAASPFVGALSALAAASPFVDPRTLSFVPASRPNGSPKS